MRTHRSTETIYVGLYVMPRGGLRSAVLITPLEVFTQLHHHSPVALGTENRRCIKKACIEFYRCDIWIHICIQQWILNSLHGTLCQEKLRVISLSIALSRWATWLDPMRIAEESGGINCGGSFEIGVVDMAPANNISLLKEEGFMA